TPLGIRLDHVRVRRDQEASPFRSLGTHAVWFPRGLLLRLAAREACRRLIEQWQDVGDPSAAAELEAAKARILNDPAPTPETLLSYGLMEHSGKRVAMAERALECMIKFCKDGAEANAARHKQQAPRTRQSQEQLQTAIENCVAGAGGFSWFGNRTKRTVRVFM